MSDCFLLGAQATALAMMVLVIFVAFWWVGPTFIGGVTSGWLLGFGTGIMLPALIVGRRGH